MPLEREIGRERERERESVCVCLGLKFRAVGIQERERGFRICEMRRLMLWLYARCTQSQPRVALKGTHIGELFIVEKVTGLHA